MEQIEVEDSPSQRETVQSCRVSRSTISRSIISANFVLQKKYKIHNLTSLNVEKRRQCALRLWRRLTNHRYKNFVTTDESWFYLDGSEGKRKVCYVKKNDSDYERMIIQQDLSHPKDLISWENHYSFC